MMKRVSTWLAATVVVFAGCGFSPQTDFSHALRGVDGQPLLLEDLEVIANDPDRTADEKREAFRELGIEDEQLIEALLDL